MKKIYLFALMAMTLTALSLTSCGDDNDTKADQTVDKADWPTNIVGTWGYDSGVLSGDVTLTVDDDVKTGRQTKRDVQSFTIGSGTGTYSQVNTDSTKWDDGTVSNYSYSVNISFTYEYKVPAQTTLGVNAYLECKVTKTDNPDQIKEGSNFYLNISSMTTNTANCFTGNERTAHTFTRK